MRKLATIERIVDIRPIPDADAIEAVVVRGWTVVSRKGEFTVGERCLYLEIDSALPLGDERFTFLEPRGVKTTIEGQRVHVLKTARLRGTYSQGLVLPLSQFPELAATPDGQDVAQLLGIEKWDPPLPASAGEIIGEFPSALARKTDAERVQNLAEVYPALVGGHRWYATEKIDGTSVTFIADPDDGRLRVCGRNYELDWESSMHGEAGRALGLAERLSPGEVVQAELYGEGVQANPLKVRGRHLAVFGFYRSRQPVPRAEWPDWLARHAAPLLDLALPATLQDAIAQVEGLRSVISPKQRAEGVVWHHVDGMELPELDFRSCFKAISNSYLLKAGG